MTVHVPQGEVLREYETKHGKAEEEDDDGARAANKAATEAPPSEVEAQEDGDLLDYTDVVNAARRGAPGAP